MERDNFYILLELPVDPPENDDGRIEAAIKKKQVEWSKTRTHPSKGRQAQVYLEYIPEIKRVMGDTGLRKTEAQEAVKINANKEKAKFEALDEAIKIVSSKGFVSKKEIDGLVKKYSGISEADLRKRVHVPIKDEAPPQRPRLPNTTAKKIRDALVIVNKSSLYEFLELSETSAVKSLADRAREKDTEVRKDANTNAINTASAELAGQCMDVFKTEDGRNMYDATRAYENLSGLDELLNSAGMDDIISPNEYDLVMQKAVSLKLLKEEAQEYIREFCKKKGWRLETSGIISVDEMKQCGVCGLVNPKTNGHCSDCGYPLDVTCPKCSQSNKSVDKVCGKCGFAVGDMPNAVSLIKKGELAFTDGDLNKSRDLFRKAELYWPGNSAIATYMGQIDAKLKEVESIVERLHDSMNKRLFYQARQTLARLRQLDRANHELKNEETITKNIDVANSLIATANTAKNEDDQLDALGLALKQCKDCREAIDAMAKLPPSAPSGLRFSTSQRSISLQWSPSKSKGDLSYRVVRKRDVLPLSVLDGENIGETVQPLWDDPDSKPGDFYYYGVYTIRGGFASIAGAVAGPVMRVCEVQDLQIMGADASVHLSWTAASGIQAIEVWRKPGALPSRPGDGIKLSGVRMDGVTDKGLKNDTLYGYIVIAVFKDEHGNDITSKGISCQATPTEPPLPVNDLKATVAKGVATLKWSRPTKGTVNLYYSQTPFSLSAGRVISTNQLSSLGSKIPTNGQAEACWPISFQGIAHILPVSIDKDTVVVGTPCMVTSIDDVSSLKGEVSNDKIFLEWDWPAGAQQARIVCRQDTFPASPEDSNASIKTLTREHYDMERAFTLKRPERKNYFFKVYIVSAAAGREIFSPGVECLVSNQEAAEVYYEVRIKKSLFNKTKSACITLYSGGPKVELPKVVVVKKLDNIPVKKSDGSAICTIEDGTIVTGKQLDFEIPITELSEGAYCRLFLADESKSSIFRLMSKGRDKQKLF